MVEKSNEFETWKSLPIENVEMERCSPIRRIPPEILRQIFLLAHTERFVSHDLKALPRVAAQVCSRWCSVVHSCAPLWTDVYCAMINHEYHPKYGKLLEDCIRFSGEMALSISFAYDVSPELLGSSCVQALGRCAYRWKSMKIVHADLATAVCSSIPECTIFAHLETLQLHDLKDTWLISEAPKLKHLFVTGDSDSNVVIESAPSLVQLTFWRVRAPSTALQGVDWSKITHFEVRCTEFQPNEVSTMLNRMPNLVSLIIQQGTIGERNSVAILMPCLETLSTGGDSLIRVETNIFDILTAPRLKELIIERGTGWAALARFLQRSQCRIEEVHLTGTSILSFWHRSLFDNIKTLIWEIPFAARDGIRQLKYRNTPSENDIFPGLENLHIVGLNGSPDMNEGPWSVVEVIDMLKSRLPPQQSQVSARRYLKFVHLEFVDLTDEHAALLTSIADSDLVRSSGVQMHISNCLF